MQFEALFFDLDGTLIDFDQNIFIQTYLGAASKYFSDLIPDPNLFTKALLDSTSIMENNDTENIAFDDFLDDFCPKFDLKRSIVVDKFRTFYNSAGFGAVSRFIKPMEGAKELLKHLESNFSEIKTVVATNPVFPLIAITRRMKWAGISPEYFDYITHAENSSFCKGNINYWLETARKVKVQPAKTLVVGNDISRDMVAKKVGFTTFLVEKRLENQHELNSEVTPDFKGKLTDIIPLIQ